MSASASSDALSQDYIPNLPQRIPVRHCKASAAREELRTLLARGPAVVGIATQLTKTGGLKAIALATQSQIVCLSVDNRGSLGIKSSAQETLENLLCGRTKTILAGFQMAYLALMISRVLGCYVRGVNLPTLFSKNTWEQKSPSALVRLKVCPNERINQIKVDGLWDVMEEHDAQTACSRAWVSACIAANSVTEIRDAIKVDISYLSTDEIACFARLAAEVHHLRSLRPSVAQNDFMEVKKAGDGYEVQNARYKTRLRPSFRTYVEVETANGIVTGRAVRSQGRQTQVKLRGVHSSDIQSIRVIGRQELNAAEKGLDEFFLQVGQGQWSADDSYFILKIWFSAHYDEMRNASVEPLPLATTAGATLNASQRRVVNAMIDEEIPIVVAHGPPGTGKTTTISVAVSHWERLRESVWIIAQSNVAVKNIAESLAKKNVDFRLIVSKEFYVEWHEHIYKKVQERLIRSDEMPQDPWEVERVFGDTCVILCTLSMLSNPVIDERGIFQLVRPERLVIDEASQINISDFLPIFYKFRFNLEKVCFFGDPNQLPPYGQDQVPLKSIFEIAHLRQTAFFLNMQYRMPEPLGDFISLHMYDSKLHSIHDVREMSCLRFIDVSSGFEEKSGKSWMNLQEVHTVVRLVRDYYKDKEFVVVTPYDAQRTELERQLKAEQLPWERVFNVDSFQGNESAYVIISIVRTDKVGFLHSHNRTNVMLSRCKRGMVIVTNREFLQTSGGDTLMARLAAHWERRHGAERTWANWRVAAEGRTHMPGVLARAPRTLPVGVSVPGPAYSQSFSIFDEDEESMWNPQDYHRGPNFGIQSSYHSSSAYYHSAPPPRSRPQPRPTFDLERDFPPLPTARRVASPVRQGWSELRQTQNVPYTSDGRRWDHPGAQQPRAPVRQPDPGPWIKRNLGRKSASGTSWHSSMPTSSRQQRKAPSSAAPQPAPKKTMGQNHGANGARAILVSERVLRIVNGTVYVPPPEKTVTMKSGDLGNYSAERDTRSRRARRRARRRQAKAVLNF